MDKPRRVVVIGCSGCGALAAMTARKLAPDLEITVIRKGEEQGLLTRCATPYICCGEVLVDPSYKDDRMFTGNGINLVNVEAVDIDRNSRSVTTADGRVYGYDRLVLATGGKPSMPPIPGMDLPGVFTLRTSGNAAGILSWINSNRVTDAVLVGAGAIGIEVAYLVSLRGVRVTLVEMLDRVMAATLDPDMSDLLEPYMRKQGLNLELGRKASSIEGGERAEGVILDSGKRLDAGLVIVSSGAIPNLELAIKAGLERGERGLKVDRFLRTSDPLIYAGGDLVEFEHRVTGRPSLGLLRPNAVIAGRIIARNILGQEAEYPPLVNAFCTKCFDKSVAAAGITETQAQKLGIDCVTATQASTSKHSMMRERKPYVVKLVFSADDGRLLGGQIVSDSESAVKSIDVIALAVRCGLGAEDLATFRAAGQPELSPDPGKEPIALAAGQALQCMREN